MHSIRYSCQSSTVSASNMFDVWYDYFNRWDTAGAERFKGVTTTYFRGANGIYMEEV